MKIGLFFGSFNPIHTGHLIIANFMVTHTALDQVWFVVSPQNPLKPKDELADDHDRLEMVRKAVADNPYFKASDIEFHLSRPSYTVATLQHLTEGESGHDFAIIMGGDSLREIHRWKDFRTILDTFPIYVYDRPFRDNSSEHFSHPNVTIMRAPLLYISATYIRSKIGEGKSVRYLVPNSVLEYLMENDIYGNLPDDGK